MHTVKKMLVVAGVSGSGKSSFIRTLRRHSLGEELESAVPSGASKWPEVVDTDLHRFAPENVRAESPWYNFFRYRLRNTIVHYNIGIEKQFPGGSDPRLSIIGRASETTVIIIQGSGRRISEQLMSRGNAPRLQERLALCADGEKLEATYRDWLAAVAERLGDSGCPLIEIEPISDIGAPKRWTIVSRRQLVTSRPMRLQDLDGGVPRDDFASAR